MLTAKMKNKTKDLNTQLLDAYIFKKKKNSRFQKCPDACGRGLGYTLCFQQKTESFAKTSGTVNSAIKKKKKKGAVLLGVSIVNEAGVERETPTRLSPALRKRAHLKNAKQQARNLLSYG